MMCGALTYHYITYMLSGDMWSSLAHFLDKAIGMGDSR